MCSARWSDLENDLLQAGHLKGLVPVCFLKCRVSSSDLNDIKVVLVDDHCPWGKIFRQSLSTNI